MKIADQIRAAIPVVETERLRLRAPRPDDLDAYARFWEGERSEFVGGRQTRARAFGLLGALVGHWAMRGFGRWMVADKATDAPMGVVGPYHPDDWPEPEIAWTVFDDYEGKGVAQEAARAALDFAWTRLGWTTAVSCIERRNARSQALARRLGARRDGVFAHPIYGDLEIWRHPRPEGAA